MSDNEGDPNSGIEVADFDDPLSSNGESKRGGGDFQHSSGAMKACEAALAAALTSNKTYIRKNEELVTELESLRENYARDIADCRQQSEFGGSSKRVSGLLEQELEQCKEKLVMQEDKLKQAAEFVNFQEEQIQDLKDEIEDAREQAAIASGDYGASTPAPGTKLGVLREELREQKDLVESLSAQIQDGASYVDHLQGKLDDALAEVAQLRAAGEDSDITTLREELAAKEEKMEQAAEFITYQEKKISELTAELEELTLKQENRGDGEGSSGGESGELRRQVEELQAQLEERESRLAQGATYCEFLQGQVNALSAELEGSKRTVEELQQQHDALSAELDSSKRAVDELQQQGRVDAISAELDSSKLSIEQLQQQHQRQIDAISAELGSSKRSIEELQQRLETAVQVQPGAGSSSSSSDDVSKKTAAITAKLQQTLRELEQSKDLCESYTAQMNTGAEYVEELKAELAEVQPRLRRLEKLQATSKGRGATGGYDANTERISNLEDELAASFADLEKMRVKLAGGGASQTEVQYYKTQNETYLIKLQQGAEYVDVLQAQLQQAEDEVARLGGSGSGGGSSGDRIQTSTSDRPSSVLEEELRECKAICTKFGLKLEQAAQLIEDLETQRDEARDGAAEGRTAVEGLKKATNRTHELAAVLGAKEELLRVATSRGSLSKADLDQAVQRMAKDIAQARAAGDAAVKEVSRLQKQLHVATSGGSESRKKLLDMEEMMSASANRRRCEQLEGIVAELRRSVGIDFPSDQIVQELIEFKMKYASAATEVDHERRKALETGLKLQAATRRIGILEAQAQARAAADEQPTSMFSFLTGGRSRSTSQASSMAHDSVHGSVAGSEAGYRDSRMRSAPLPRHGPTLAGPATPVRGPGPGPGANPGRGGAVAGRGAVGGRQPSGPGGLPMSPSPAGTPGSGRPPAGRQGTAGGGPPAAPLRR